MRKQFSSEEVVKLLAKWGYEPVNRTGSHLKLRYEQSETGLVRTTVVPMGKDPVKEGTLRSIAEDCGANSFRRFCKELERWL